MGTSANNLQNNDCQDKRFFYFLPKYSQWWCRCNITM